MGGSPVKPLLHTPTLDIDAVAKASRNAVQAIAGTDTSVTIDKPRDKSSHDVRLRFRRNPALRDELPQQSTGVIADCIRVLRRPDVVRLLPRPEPGRAS